MPIRITLYMLMAIVLVGGQTVSCSAQNDLVKHTEERSLMGSIFQISAVAETEEKAAKAVEAAYTEAARIESLISSWNPASQTSEINRQAGIRPVKVDKELYDLIFRSKKVSQLTGGIFDISFASIDQVWTFDGSMTELPSEDEILASVARIGYEKIILNPEDTSVFLAQRGMKIGFGGIGKGYAANRCRKVMEDMNITGGVVNAGGDLIAWGHQASGKPWTIGIVDPDRKHAALSWLEISGTAVVTSGDYERFVEIGGVRYCHIINPMTGWPARMLRSVTIICPDAELADALATSVFILGIEEGIGLIDRLKDIECLIIDEQGELYASEGIDLNYYEEVED